MRPRKPTKEEGGLALLLIDLDGLKAVNDCDGHARGDALLRDFAQGLQQQLREGVGVYRLGGDEFTVLAPARDVDCMLSALRQLEGAMLALADQRMYQHKNSRRRARASDVLVATGR